jgi:hypothetical protein
MGTNNINRTSESPHPMYGIRPGFNISDLDNNAAIQISALIDITVATKSAIFSGVRFLSIIFSAASTNTTAQIDLYTSLSGVDTLVYSFVGASNLTQAIYMGGFEGVDLQGGPFKIGVSNIVNASAINVNYRING